MTRGKELDLPGIMKRTLYHTYDSFTST